MPQRKKSFFTVLNFAGRSVAALIGLALIFWVLLSVVYAIPSSAFEREGKASVAILSEEGLWPESALEGITIDNFTVGWMLNMAVHNGENPFYASLLNPWSGADEEDQIQRLENWADDPEQPADHSYSRYWNGYLLYLKPLLVFFNLNQIRLILQTTFFTLLFIAAASLVQRFGRSGVISGAFLVFSYVVLGAADAVAVLPLFPSFALSAIGVLWIAHVELELRKIARGFLILGAFTVFFDMLDNPILVLGMPAVVLVLRSMRTRSVKWLVKALLISTICWVCAYGFTWVMKWMIASLVLGQNIIAEGFERIAYRSGSLDGLDAITQPLPYVAIRDNLKQGATLFVLIIIVLFTLTLLLKTFVDARRRVSLQTLAPYFLCLLSIAALPYFWYVIVANHSVIHSWFTYRDQTITLFALLACMQCLALPCASDGHNI